MRACSTADSPVHTDMYSGVFTWPQGVFGPGATLTDAATSSPSPSPPAPAAAPAPQPPTSLPSPPPPSGAPTAPAPSAGSNFVPISPTSGASPGPGAQARPFQ
jgi:hypothetical protein